MHPKDMSSDIKTLWLVVGITLAALLPALFVPVLYSRLVAAALLAVAAGAALVLIKKRRIPSLHYRQVMGLLAVTAVVYLMLCYISGLHFGFYKNYPTLSISTLARYILPAAVIITATEIIRSVLLAQKGIAISVVSYLLCIVSDLLLGQGVSLIGEMHRFLDIVGLTLFPAITSNLLYHYLARRYGALPNIVYRLLLSLTMSFLPIVPAVPDALNAFVLVVLPLGVWIFMDLLYEKKKKQKRSRLRALSYAGTGLCMVCMVTVIMLITCQFQYGMIIIATPSMQGSINVGDAVVYEAYDGQIIREDDIIVFSKDGNAKIIHRVVEIENINGQNRYYTKGDANAEQDFGYVTAENIVGVVQFKVSYIGYPSLWLRDLFT